MHCCYRLWQRRLQHECPAWSETDIHPVPCRLGGQLWEGQVLAAAGQRKSTAGSAALTGLQGPRARCEELRISGMLCRVHETCFLCEIVVLVSVVLPQAFPGYR